MALTRPILDSISIFDATTEYKFTYKAIGGDQIYGNNVEIRNSSTNAIVYNQTINNFRFEHILNANTLTNGVTYTIRIRTKNQNGLFSDWSDSVIFTCYSKAIVRITNLTNNQLVNNQSYNFTGSYSQAQSIGIHSYRFFLYDHNQVMIGASVSKYDDLLEHTFSGFINGRAYFVELRVLNEKNIESSSGLIRFTSEYITPNLSATLELANDKDSASIKINIELIRVLFSNTGGTYSFEDTTWINLKDGKIHADDGFSLNNEWTLQMWCKDITINNPFLTFYDRDNNTITLQYDGTNVWVTRMNKKYPNVIYKLGKKVGTLTPSRVVKITISQMGGLMELDVNCGAGTDKLAPMNTKRDCVGLNPLYYNNEINGNYSAINTAITINKLSSIQEYSNEYLQINFENICILDDGLYKKY